MKTKSPIASPRDTPGFRQGSVVDESYATGFDRCNGFWLEKIRPLVEAVQNHIAEMDEHEAARPNACSPSTVFLAEALRPFLSHD